MSTHSTPFNDFVVPDKKDASLAVTSSRQLAPYLHANQPVTIQLTGKNNVKASAKLPSAAFRLLLDILTQMAAGNAVSLVPLHKDLTTQEAANLEIIKSGVFVAIRTNFVLRNMRNMKLSSAEAMDCFNGFFQSQVREYFKLAKELARKENAKGNVQYNLTFPEKLAFFSTKKTEQTSPKKEPKPEDPIISKLKELSGLEDADWKIYPNHGNLVTVPVEIASSSKTKESLCQYSEAFSVRLCKNPKDTSTYLLAIEKIDITRLNLCAPQPREIFPPENDGPPL